MDIDKLEAGRELDALVAERVMGAVWDESRCRICGWPLGEEGTLHSCACTQTSCAMRPAPPRRADDPAHYSTEIAAAWLVVARLHEIVFASDEDDPLNFLVLICLGGEYVATFAMECEASRLYDGPTAWMNYPYTSAAETAPLAICRAALKAKGAGDA